MPRTGSPHTRACTTSSGCRKGCLRGCEAPAGRCCRRQGRRRRARAMPQRVDGQAAPAVEAPPAHPHPWGRSDAPIRRSARPPRLAHVVGHDAASVCQRGTHPVPGRERLADRFVALVAVHVGVSAPVAAPARRAGPVPGRTVRSDPSGGGPRRRAPRRSGTGPRLHAHRSAHAPRQRVGHLIDASIVQCPARPSAGALGPIRKWLRRASARGEPRSVIVQRERRAEYRRTLRRAMLVRRARARRQRAAVVGREDAADEGDQGQARGGRSSLMASTYHQR
jgi:hypothetical protein